METGGSIDAPAHRVERVGDRLVLTGRAPGTKEQEPNLFRYPLSIPGEARLPETGWVVSAQWAEGSATLGNGPIARAVADEAMVRGDLCRGPLSVRNRRPGDRFRPVGLDGRKKLQDFFVDRKVARRDRDAVPLVVDAADRIVWVAGHGIDEAFRVTNPAQTVVIFKVRRV